MTSCKTPRSRVGLGLTAGAMISIFGAGCDEMQTRTPIDVASLGPQVGEAVPEFSLPDQSGRTQTLESIMGPNGAMLLFHRSADW